MRRLWITRRKSAAACLAKMKVYIEDPEGDTLINGFPCRKLGDLKNGQKGSFAIGSEAARVFVVADSLSRNLYNEFADLPAGEEDVVLSGKNVLEPFSGNPFRFDGVASEAVRENREQTEKRGRKLLVGTILTAILLGTVLNVFILSRLMSDQSGRMGPRIFAAEELQITLTEKFEEIEVPGYTACFSAGETAVFVLREDMEQMKPYGNLSLDAYGVMILANNGFDQSVRLNKEDGLITFDAMRQASDSDEEYYYYCGLFRSERAYWMIQITTLADDPQELEPLFLQWLKSVCFGL